MATNRLEALFEVLPAALQGVGLGLYSALDQKSKYGAIYQRCVGELRANARKSRSELEEVQRTHLAELLMLVWNDPTCKYRETMNDCSINSMLISSDPFAALQRLPVIDKESFKQNLTSYAVGSVGTASTANTSGTTGAPMQIPYDSHGIEAGFAYWRRFYDFMGLPNSFKNARFSGRILTKRPKPRLDELCVYDWYEKRLFLSTYHMTDDSLAYYVARLNALRPELIDGYPSAIECLAKYLNERDMRLSFQPIAVAVTAETLSEDQRQLTEKVFGAKVFNQYASSEGAPFMTECCDGRMHLNIDTGVFEFLDIEANAEMAELVVTSFRNRKLPLIRYRIGDVVTKPIMDIKCPCGFDTPFVEKVIGRTDDVLKSTERGLIGRLDPIYKGVGGISRSQIIQYGKDRFRILVVPEPAFSTKDLKQLEQNFLDRLGHSVDLEINTVDSIPLSKNGKFRAVVRQDVDSERV